MSLRRLAAATLAGVLLAGAAGAFAHQLKAALTTVRANPRTELVEVVHRFYVHDAEHAVRRLGGLRGDLFADRTLQTAFARYVAHRFTLADETGEALPLELVGTELEGDFLWVYQEMPAATLERVAAVRQEALQELWPEQVNQVNLERDGRVRTLLLRRGDGLEPLEPAAADGLAGPP
mgnify:FL=1